MTRQQLLLTILAEECNEVAQRAIKAVRFGVAEVQPEQDSTNADRIKYEMIDLIAVYGMLCSEGVLSVLTVEDESAAKKKIDKVEKFLDYSRVCGVLKE